MAQSTLTCLIIDDEPDARELVEKMIRKVPFLKVLASCNNAIEALNKVQELVPDIIFLDIEMPHINGFDLLTLLPEPRPAVIMITADPSYAIEGFTRQIADYLLKPVAFDRFMKAVNKVIATRGQHARVSEENLGCGGGEPTLPKLRMDYLLIKENKRLVRIEPNEIRYVEGMKDYLKVYWSERISVVHLTMTKIEERLRQPDFIRIHRSFLVNKDVISEIEGNELTIVGGKKFPIGVTHRSHVMQLLQKNLV